MEVVLFDSYQSNQQVDCLGVLWWQQFRMRILWRATQDKAKKL